MNTSIKPKSAARHLWWLIPLTSIFLVPAILAVSVVGCLRLNGETKALRDSLMKSTEVKWDKQIEISIGGILFSLARFGVSFFDVEPEVRAGIDTMRGARVGVYRLSSGREALQPAEFLNAADQSLIDSDWERFVTVLNRNEMVAIYGLKEREPSNEIEICVVVVNEHDLVIVSARANPEPLIDLAMREIRKQSKNGNKPRFLEPRHHLTISGNQEDSAATFEAAADASLEPYAVEAAERRASLGAPTAEHQSHSQVEE